MTKADTAYAQLLSALAVESPACGGNSLYTADHVAADELRFLEKICASCPVFTECQNYARAARPPAGIWAGSNWAEKKPNGRPKGTSDAARATADRQNRG